MPRVCRRQVFKKSFDSTYYYRVLSNARRMFRAPRLKFVICTYSIYYRVLSNAGRIFRVPRLKFVIRTYSTCYRVLSSARRIFRVPRLKFVIDTYLAKSVVWGHISLRIAYNSLPYDSALITSLPCVSTYNMPTST